MILEEPNFWLGVGIACMIGIAGLQIWLVYENRRFYSKYAIEQNGVQK